MPEKRIKVSASARAKAHERRVQVGDTQASASMTSALPTASSDPFAATATTTPQPGVFTQGATVVTESGHGTIVGTSQGKYGELFEVEQGGEVETYHPSRMLHPYRDHPEWHEAVNEMERELHGKDGANADPLIEKVAKDTGNYPSALLERALRDGEERQTLRSSVARIRYEMGADGQVTPEKSALRVAAALHENGVPKRDADRVAEEALDVYERERSGVRLLS